MIAIDLCKKQALDPDRKAIQQTNFTGNLDRPEDATMFFVTEKHNINIILNYQKYVTSLSFNKF